MCYMLQAFGTISPPADASRLIRHHFSDTQLHEYIVKDGGGDSTAILKILDKLFFNCDYKYRPYYTIATEDIVTVTMIQTLLEEQGPGLVSKFCVPSKFYCDEQMGTKGPGVARFTEWGKAATFIPLDSQPMMLRSTMKRC